MIQNAKAKTANNGPSNATAGSKSSDINTKEHRTAEAVVNIEKLMKKLEKMEKNSGGKALKDDGSSPMKNKKAKIEEDDKPAEDNGKGKNNADSATSGSASASAAQATSESIAPKNEKKSTKNKKNKDKNKKKETDSVKPEYIPDAEALAKREERKRKKEARLAGSTKTTSTSAATAIEDGEMAVDGDAEADVSSMHIDTLEETAAPVLEPILSADARTPMSSKKMKQKTKTDIATASPVAVEVNSAKAKDIIEDGMTDLQKRMQKKLGGARFRWINEQLVRHLYTRLFTPPGYYH